MGPVEAPSIPVINDYQTPVLVAGGDLTLMQRIWNVITRALRCLFCCCCAPPAERALPTHPRGRIIDLTQLTTLLTQPISDQYHILWQASAATYDAEDPEEKRIFGERLQEITQNMENLTWDDLQDLCAEAFSHQHDIFKFRLSMAQDVNSGDLTKRLRDLTAGCAVDVAVATSKKGCLSLFRNPNDDITQLQKRTMSAGSKPSVFSQIMTSIHHNWNSLHPEDKQTTARDQDRQIGFMTAQMEPLRQTMVQQVQSSYEEIIGGAN